MVTVMVVNESSGKPLKGCKVALGKSAFLSGGVTSSEWTDGRGEAHFQTHPGEGKVFVDGSTVFEGYLKGRIVVYV